jgi:hypothetical protein
MRVASHSLLRCVELPVKTYSNPSIWPDDKAETANAPIRQVLAESNRPRTHVELVSQARVQAHPELVALPEVWPLRELMRQQVGYLCIHN